MKSEQILADTCMHTRLQSEFKSKLRYRSKSMSKGLEPHTRVRSSLGRVRRPKVPSTVGYFVRGVTHGLRGLQTEAMRAALSEHFVFRVSRYSTVRDGAIEIGACGSQPADFCHEQQAEIDRPASRFLSLPTKERSMSRTRTRSPSP